MEQDRSRDRAARRQGRRDGSIPLVAALLCPLLAAAPGCAVSQQDEAHTREVRGLKQLEDGRTREGFAELEAALALDPGLYRAALAVANERRRRGKVVEALSIVEQLVGRKPKLAIARMHLGDLYASLGMDDEALIQYRATARLWNDAYAPAFVAMARVYQRRNQDRDAERALRRAVSTSPGNTGALYALARLYQKRRLPQAREVWGRYLAYALNAPRENPARIREARERLAVEGGAVSRADASAVVRALRRLLRPSAPGAGPRPVSEVARDVRTPLERPFFGRIFVRLYAASVEEPITGVGQGATFWEAVVELAGDVRRSRAFSIQLAPRLPSVRFQVAFEIGLGRDLVLEEGPGGALSVKGFEPGRDALELRLPNGRSLALLPADAARRGLRDAGACVAAATLWLGVPESAARTAKLKRLRVRSWIEGEGDRRPLPLRRGIVAPRAEGARARVRALAATVARRLEFSLLPGGRFASGWDPVRDRAIAVAPSIADHVAVAATLARAGRALDDGRARDTARAAFALLRTRVQTVGKESFVASDAASAPDAAATAEMLQLALEVDDPELAAALARWLVSNGTLLAAAPQVVAHRAALALVRWSRRQPEAVAEASLVAERAAAKLLGAAYPPRRWPAGPQAGAGKPVALLSAPAAAAVSSLPLSAVPALVALGSGPRADARARGRLTRALQVTRGSLRDRPFSVPALEAFAALVAAEATGGPADDELTLRAIAATESLLYDAERGFAFPASRERLEGLFRAGPLDPRAAVPVAARRLDALLRLLPRS